MFSRQSPRKRKHSEYHDPDYHQEQPTCDNSSSAKRQNLEETFVDRNDAQRIDYLQKVQDIIEREFNRELSFKQQQLHEIDERLLKARSLLEKLRYALVSSYYKKQDLPLAAVTSSAVRGVQTLFNREDKGPQMQIHPSLKKLIGKKPKDLSDVIRSCPKRTAAQNAVQTIRAKSEVQKREERKLKQIIRGQGIVIDHSIDQGKRTDVTSLLNAAHRCSVSKSICQPNVNVVNSDTNVLKHTPGKPLISSRLNNKVKHLVVVGNTSKFIGSEQERDPRNKSQILTHKWLVYVQSKESTVPIERYIRKIRFYLHHSYRPNDVVDIESPPFHVARRGWGEFPIRVQLYFRQDYRQKPVQLLHTVVLDKTLSGIQTMGAETLLEVWLRNIDPIDVINKDVIEEDQPKTTEKSKQNRISPSEELVDDNLLEFLNKIEATQSSISADIEKIQPTFVISDAMAVKSPRKTDNTSSKSPIKTPEENLTRPVPVTRCQHSLTTTSQNSLTATSSQHSGTIITTCQHSGATARTNRITSDIVATKDIRSEQLVSNPQTTYTNLSQMSTHIKFANLSNKHTVAKMLPLNTIPTTNPNPNTTISKASIILNKDGKVITPLSSVASVVRRTVLPVSNATTITTNTHSTPVPSSSSCTNTVKPLPANSNAPKQILQKKLVQLVDATGKVKYMQMLVAATSTAPPTKNYESTSSLAPKLITVGSSGVRNTSGTYTTQTTKTTPVPIQKFTNGSISTITTGGLTMKPNIFKIVSENMQTKPQVLTFSTITSASTTTTMTSVSSIQIKNKTTTMVPKQNNVASKVMQKSNGSATKNVVFHKEGKVYIIDPLQNKLKQQQKKQVSLLKPQVSLLKQQIQQHETPATIKTVAKKLDHDYLSPPYLGLQNNAPQVHFGLKQQRLNSISMLQLMQMKRILFEKQILRQQFTNMRGAVEFILRRLKLIAPKESLVAAFPFVSHTDPQFQSLTAFKQRSYEWLRAKHISRLIRNHTDLQKVNNTTRETFWSTKEIANFARQYAYTPNIKSLPTLMGKLEENCKGFKEMVKGELKQDEITPYDTLTGCHTIVKWINKVWPIFVDYQYCEDQSQIIDVDNTREDAQEDSSGRNKPLSHLKQVTSLTSKDTYLSPPQYLENECNLVSDICKDLNVKLVPEELADNIWHPSTQTILAHSLNIFLQKIVRSAMGLKFQEKSATKESVYIIQPSDIAKVLSHSIEFDFLTNKNFGTNSRVVTPLITSVKEETS